MTSTRTQPAWEKQLNASAQWVLQHWLLFANGLVLLYGGLPWVSPLAHSFGYHQLGDVLFRIYTPLCHQDPDHSFFLNGYQVAFCQREAMMYTALFLGGLLFAALREHVRPVSIRVGLLLLLPMLLDGGSQLIDDLLPMPVLRGFDDSIGSLNFWMRMITGFLFAIAIFLAVYPRFERDLRHTQLGAY